jgi:hypothetical protein
MAHSLSHSAADPELSSVSYSDLEEPWSDCHEALLSHYHQTLDSSSTDQCAACSHRQQRSKMALVVLLVWAVPLALAGGRWYGLWGPMHHTVNDNPRGHLILAQVSPSAYSNCRTAAKVALRFTVMQQEALAKCATLGL